MQDAPARRENKWIAIGSGVLRVIEVAAIVGGVIFAAFQIQDLKNDQSAQMMLQFNSSLSEQTNSELITTIEDGKPILTQDGGQFTTTDLDRYLSVYDLLNEVSAAGLINDEMLYNGFSYDIIATYDDKEVEAYIAQVRTASKDPTLFGGYEALAKSLIAAQN